MTINELIAKLEYVRDELDLLRSDLEDDIIWENKMKKYKKRNNSSEPPMSIH